MAQHNGRLTVCDRCGKTEFSKCTGEKETDGGYTRWNTFEPLTPGWDAVQIRFKHYRLCPECMRQLMKIFDEFIKPAEEATT